MITRNNDRVQRVYYDALLCRVLVESNRPVTLLHNVHCIYGLVITTIVNYLQASSIITLTRLRIIIILRSYVCRET